MNIPNSRPVKPGACEHLVESDKILSQSVLWQQMRNFYEIKGVEAWSKGIVPSFITSNAFIAQAYAKTIYACIDDLLSANKLDPSKPIYILELGAGSGKLSFHLINALLQRHGVIYGDKSRPGQSVRIRYIMTDFARGNLGAWRSHPALQGFVEKGILDFAEFDVERHDSLKLEVSGVEISPQEPLENPYVVVANYVFDSLPCDVFQIDKSGRILEGKANIYSYAEERDPAQPETLERFKATFTWDEVSSDRIDRYYDSDALEVNPFFAAMMRWYRDKFAGREATINFPKGGIRCLAKLQKLSHGIIMLSADKGLAQTEQMTGLVDPHIACHGSFSMMVNYHALGLWFLERHGYFLHSSGRHRDLHISLFLLDSNTVGEAPQGYGGRPSSLGHWNPVFSRTKLAFEDFVDSFGPASFFALQGVTEKVRQIPEVLSLDAALSLLRLSYFDPDLFYKLRDVIATRTIGIDSRCLKADMLYGLQRVWQNFFFIENGADIPYELARVYYAMEEYAQAIEFYGKSRELYGEYFITDYNLALAYSSLGEVELALQSVQKSLQQNPTYASSLRLHSDLSKRDTSVVAPKQKQYALVQNPVVRNKNSLTHRTTVDPDVLTRKCR